jgi:nicotinic acid mononucleotide adenylyltransferase
VGTSNVKARVTVNENARQLADQTNTEQWRARYAATGRMLNDVGHMLELRARLGADQSRARAAVVAGQVVPQHARRVGVFAGSFNPLTIAHGTLVAAARDARQLDAMLWAFSRVTVDKEAVERASLLDRVAQMEAFVTHTAPSDAVVVMDAGLYADEAVALRALVPADAELWILVGFDKIVQIFDPRYYEDRDAALRRLFSAARVLVAPRDGNGERELMALLDAPENRPYAPSVDYLALPAGTAHISSSEARRAAASTDGMAAVELASLLEPEGAALAVTTGAYASSAAGSPHGELDRYGLRMAWLRALASEPQVAPIRMTLVQLVDAASAEDERGAALRRWVAGERWPGSPRTTHELIERYL